MFCIYIVVLSGIFATLAVLPWDAGATLRDCSLAAAGQEPATPIQGRTSCQRKSAQSWYRLCIYQHYATTAVEKDINQLTINILNTSLKLFNQPVL